MIIPDNIRYIVNTLFNNGYEAYYVGGFVRDYLLGQKYSDIDIATNATTDQIVDIFARHKLNIVGATFKVVKVDDTDVATYRKDIYYGNSDKNCIIKTASSIYEDLARRDFTINSIAINPITHEIIDPYNGVKDIELRILRFTGEAKKRIIEDPCRILRAARYLAKINGSVHYGTFQALKDNSELVEYVDSERIRIEILKVMKYEKPSIFFNLLLSTGILERILPSLSMCKDLDGGKYHDEDVFTHSMLVGDYLPSKCPILRLSGYLHDIGKPYTASYYDDSIHFIHHDKVGAEILKDELKLLSFSNKEIDYICNMAETHLMGMYGKDTPKAIRKRIKRMKECNIRIEDFIRLTLADRKGNLKNEIIELSEVKQMLKNIDDQLINYKNTAFSVTDLNINGNNIMEILNIPQGKEIGVILTYLLELVLDNPELNNKELLTKLVKEYKSC